MDRTSATMPVLLRVQRVVLRLNGATHFGTIHWVCPINLQACVKIDTLPAAYGTELRRFDTGYEALSDDNCKAIPEQEWEEGVNRRWHLRDIAHHPRYGWVLMC